MLFRSRAPAAVEIHPLLAGRWSPYCFAERPVPTGDLHALFEAARWAPSSYNEQPWAFLVASRDTRPDAHARLLDCLWDVNREWARFAPVLGLGLARPTFDRNGVSNPAAEHDLGLAMGMLTVEATARDLQVHQMMGLDPDRARSLFRIPADWTPRVAFALGYAGLQPDMAPELQSRDAERRPRRTVDAFVFDAEAGWGHAYPFDEPGP